MSQPHGGHGHGKGENPLVQMMVSMSGAAAPEHETEPPGADPTSFRAGHEPDKFQVKGILYVPAIVAVTLVITYVFVTVVFGAIRNPKQPEASNPAVVKLNDNSFNDRVGRISSTDPKAVDGKPGTAVAQPRLEFMREQSEGPNDPSFYRSKRAMQERNPPEVRPQDLRPENYIDPATGKKILVEWAYINGNKDVIRVPIDEAIHLVEQGVIKLPVRKDPVVVSRTSEAVAKQSNAGHAGTAFTDAPKEQPKKDEHGKQH